MTSLPEADAATRAYFIAWLERFAGYVREVDYAAARPLFHPDILAFGTHRDIISGLATWQATQWDNVWPKTSDFRFDTGAARILASADNTMATVVVSWTSTGYTQNGAAFDRPGRATMVFHNNDGAWLCAHSHMSLNRGVPQQSFANRPVKAK
jgi:ketosteroid isomerase-like protein